MDIINNRRSIRKFIDKPVEPEKIERILKAAMQAPSSENKQPWEFIVIDDRKMLDEFSSFSDYAKAVNSAPVAIVLLGNKDRLDNLDYWEQDMGAATQNLMLEAVNQELGSVWLGVYTDEGCITFIKKFFDLPDNILPYSVVPIGYSDRENKFTDRYKEERVHFNKW